MSAAEDLPEGYVALLSSRTSSAGYDAETKERIARQLEDLGVFVVRRDKVLHSEKVGEIPLPRRHFVPEWADLLRFCWASSHTKDQAIRQAVADETFREAVLTVFRLGGHNALMYFIRTNVGTP